LGASTNKGKVIEKRERRKGGGLERGGGSRQGRNLILMIRRKDRVLEQKRAHDNNLR